MSSQPRVSVPPAVADREIFVQGDFLEPYQPTIFEARARFFAALGADRAAGVVLKELLRLRNAVHTDCEY